MGNLEEIKAISMKYMSQTLGSALDQQQADKVEMSQFTKEYLDKFNELLSKTAMPIERSYLDVGVKCAGAKKEIVDLYQKILLVYISKVMNNEILSEEEIKRLNLLLGLSGYLMVMSKYEQIEEKGENLLRPIQLVANELYSSRKEFMEGETNEEVVNKMFANVARNEKIVGILANYENVENIVKTFEENEVQSKKRAKKEEELNFKDEYEKMM